MVARLGVVFVFIAGCHADLLDELCPPDGTCLALRVAGEVGTLDQLAVIGLEGIALSPPTALTPPERGAEFALPVLVPISVGDFAGTFRLGVRGLRAGVVRAQGEVSGRLGRGERRLFEVGLTVVATACDRPCPLEADCLDGSDDDGDGLVDCEDPDCDDRVVCVDAADAGQLGWFAASDGDCPEGEELLYAGLEETGSCPACACDTRVTCRYGLFRTDEVGCAFPNPLAIFVEETGPSEAPLPTCVSTASVEAPNAMSFSRDAPRTRCLSSSPSPAPLRWSLSSRFCRSARASQSCGSGRMCVLRSASGAAPCVRVPVGAGCPAGMPAAVGQWHRADEIEDDRLCACGCRLTGTAVCQGRAAFTMHAGTACAPPERGSFEVNGTADYFCGSDGGSWTQSFQSIKIVASEWSGAGCSPDGGEVGAARAVGGSIVCCAQ